MRSSLSSYVYLLNLSLSVVVLRAYALSKCTRPGCPGEWRRSRPRYRVQIINMTVLLGDTETNACKAQNPYQQRRIKELLQSEPSHPLSKATSKKECRQVGLLLSLKINHSANDVILVLRPKSFRVWLSCANQRFDYLNLIGITEFKYERKNEKGSGRSSRMTPSCKWSIESSLSKWGQEQNLSSKEKKI